ncbi:hypothetical protein CVT26_011638 [Gymnopilus dilepis]|uniref:DUF659 domain-containing protein n=1 Tax=Gymnopilus dilepis TaxID=231916 RepID=A0A409XAR5_9AGAR|nr:hypothetical protein CVT26_011638 [Gymnopilus dilepis]
MLKASGCGYLWMKTGRPHYWIPSASTVGHDVRLVFARTRERIGKILQEYNRKLNFTTDAWTSPNHYAYIALTVTFVVKGHPVSLVLDIVELPKSHSGINLAAAFAEILRNFGNEHKILSVTCDNATNNDKMVQEMHDILPAFNRVNRTRCFAHIINLVAKLLLKQFEVKKITEDELKKLSNEERELLKLAGDITIEELTMAQEQDEEENDDDDDDVDVWVDEVEALSEDERQDLEESVRPIKRVLVKVSYNFKFYYIP